MWGWCLLFVVLAFVAGMYYGPKVTAWIKANVK